MIRLSVRNFVEFLLRSGDIDNRRKGTKEKDAMQEGVRIHKKLQKNMGAEYEAEVSMKASFLLTSFVMENDKQNFNEDELTLVLEGRADGILENMKFCNVPEQEVYWYTSEYGPMEEESVQFSNWRRQKIEKTCPLVDEIKGVYRSVSQILEPVPVHLAQALCYAYMYCMKKHANEICVQISYCNIESEQIRRFRRLYTKIELQEIMDEYLREYTKWALFTVIHNKKRDNSICTLQFPFCYRPGQKKMVASVYQTIKHEKNIFIQAPTGIGKTISTTFPAVKAMGEGKIKKIFYLTAKTITRTVAEESFVRMREKGGFLSSITITAKEKLCVLEEMNCNPISCPRAKGHFDRVNRAIYDFITNELAGTREKILLYAEKYNVCPFEFCLDLSLWMDAIICDYNYVFDPNVYLQRYFGDGIREDYVFLVDEAHNLVERAREMYSASICKEDILEAEKIYKEYPSIRKLLNRLNRKMLALKRECEDYVILPEGKGLEDIVEHMNRLYVSLQEFPEKYPDAKFTQEISKEADAFFFLVRDFVMVWELVDENYKVYTELLEDGRFMIRLFCVNPANNLRKYMDRGKTTVFFSATMLPIAYYKKLLGATEEDYAMYVDSPFLEEKRILCIGSDVTSRYTRRGAFMYRKIATYILNAIKVKSGNYMVFFPSYQFMEAVVEEIQKNGQIQGFKGQLLLQQSTMSEEEREQFLQAFSKKSEIAKTTLIGCCVIGGSFSEGIDLKEDSLIGVFVVGTGIPLVCTERKILQQHFEEESKNGYDFAYRYPGMNKVLQAAGRLIRTPEDVGMIALLDDRFLQLDYMELFPREWEHYCPVTEQTICEEVKAFWKNLL